MTTLKSKLVAVLILVAALAGCAATGTQESALQWLERERQAQGD